ncbi:bifunctional hydroxymethylpyrimidine kinase/phosphomethylpyrimidine kinase [Acidimicrobiaceae bacterium USS-CC1]|uniref:Bifunctional hydroxymethylpyrimidine kinase/phosphomethylpyrimidine kinase n=1 Tax=Acidiferrimicrobium australe TaxID=2664430 RepID=A0ABW9QWX9_9ACTN|nr:bifunctional hydroxymethylpyrimidine kinase/phosphomethylpyrimidine kinase [Acidiferrimicrobium australe]
MTSRTPPVVLSIAGSDSGGGAGIQADLRTFAALCVFGTTAVTAVTAQNTTGVRRVDVLPPEAVTAQVMAVLDDLPVAAVKTGMLADAGTVDAVAGMAAAERLPNLVVDPVMVASSGAVLASDDVVAAYRRRLLHLATVVTPNVAEAAVLADVTGAAAADQTVLARILGERTGATVVVTGGHAGGPRCADVVWHAGEIQVLARPRLATGNTHGSGCTFAAAVTAGLATGAGVLEAVQAAGEFVHAALRSGSSWRLGAGPGPLDHFGWSRPEVGTGPAGTEA